MTFVTLLKPYLWKNLILKLYAKMLPANKIAGFWNFNIWKTIGGIKLSFSMQIHIF